MRGLHTGVHSSIVYSGQKVKTIECPSVGEQMNEPWGCCSCCSVTKSCVTVCNPMDCSTPGLPVHHQLLEFTQTHVHWVGDPTISSSVVPFSSCPQSFPASGSFPMSQLFISGDQSIGASASASVLPMNIQDWFPLRLTRLIPLQSERFLEVFSSLLRTLCCEISQWKKDKSCMILLVWGT